MNKVSFDSFKTWLASQNDVDLIYYLDLTDCLFARFLKFSYPEVSDIRVGGQLYYVGESSYYIPLEITEGLEVLLKGKGGCFTIADAKKQFLS